MMDKERFYQALRAGGLFPRGLSQRQVDGIEALLAAGRGLPLQEMANVLANVHHETGGGMYPVKETVMPHHADQNPSDGEVIRRLDRAFAAGQLPWVKKPYWKTGEFGRGMLQITHAENREKLGIRNREDLLRPDVSARAAVEGMRRGIFTGRKLGDYTFPADLDNPPATNPRRIVNGQDGSDGRVASYHRAFVPALEAGGWGASSGSPWAALLALLAKIFGGRK